tara:strand:- start:3305 stop:3526 length:222 start_codon:yes stop_codon:yes gene_type:complete
MKTYITFGQIHTHSHNGITLDKDCVGEIEAKSYSEARELAFKWFGGKFGATYPQRMITNKFLIHFPRGIIKLN